MDGRSPVPGRRDIPAVQYLRAVAALMVVWHHAAGQVPGMAAFVPSSFGTSGVDLFFAISGFIMVVTTSGKPVGALEFWRRRIVRVVPLYWLLTLAMVMAALLAPALFKTLKVEPATLLQSLFFVPHFSRSFPDQAWPLLVPGWTLNFEMFFYACFGAALLLPVWLRLVVLTAGLVLAVAAGSVAGPFASAAARTYTHPMLLEFAVGMWIGVAWLHRRLQFPFVAALAMLVTGSALLVSRELPGPAYLAQIAGAGLVLAGALHERFAAWHLRVWHAIGDSSYSLYLTHVFTLGAMRVVWSRFFEDAPGAGATAAFMVAALAACAAVGWLSYRWLEQPLLRLFNGPRPPIGSGVGYGASPTR